MSNEILQIILRNRKTTVNELKPSLFTKVTYFMDEDEDFASNLEEISSKSLDDLVNARVGRTKKLKLEREIEEKPIPLFFSPSLPNFAFTKETFDKVSKLPYAELFLDAEDVYASAALSKVPENYRQFNGLAEKYKISSLLDYALLRVKLDKEEELLKEQKSKLSDSRDKRSEVIKENVLNRLEISYGSRPQINALYEENMEAQAISHFDEIAIKVREAYNLLADEERATLDSEMHSLRRIQDKKFIPGDKVMLSTGFDGEVTQVKSYIFGLFKRVKVNIGSRIVSVSPSRVGKKATPFLQRVMDSEYDLDLVAELTREVKSFYARKAIEENDFNNNFARDVISGRYPESVSILLRDVVENYDSNIEDESRLSGNTSRRIKRIRHCINVFEKEVSKSKK